MISERVLGCERVFPNTSFSFSSEACKGVCHLIDFITLRPSIPEKIFGKNFHQKLSKIGVKVKVNNHSKKENGGVSSMCN